MHTLYSHFPTYAEVGQWLPTAVSSVLSRVPLHHLIPARHPRPSSPSHTVHLIRPCIYSPSHHLSVTHVPAISTGTLSKLGRRRQ